MKRYAQYFSFVLAVWLMPTEIIRSKAQSRNVLQNQNATQPKQVQKQLKGYKLVMLDMLDSLYGVNRFTLNTQELYGIDETIEVYNVKIAGIALFSVLPDFSSESNWTEMELEDIQEALLNNREFDRIVREKGLSSGSRTKTMDVRLVKKEKGKYWVSNVCLLELFIPDEYISDVYPSIFNVQQGRLNIGQTPIQIGQMLDVFERTMNLSFPMDLRISSVSILPNRPELEREYLSKIIGLNGEKAYQFWTFSDWSSWSGYCYHRGVDRFIYIPDKGIVAGSYDFYFLVPIDTGWDFLAKTRELRPRHRKTTEELWQNIVEEKVMIAEELKMK